MGSVDGETGFSLAESDAAAMSLSTGQNCRRTMKRVELKKEAPESRPDGLSNFRARGGS